MEHMLFFSNVRVCCSQLTHPAYSYFATVMDFNLSTIILKFCIRSHDEILIEVFLVQ